MIFNFFREFIVDDHVPSGNSCSLDSTIVLQEKGWQNVIDQ